MKLKALCEEELISAKATIGGKEYTINDVLLMAGYQTKKVDPIRHQGFEWGVYEKDE